MVTYFGRLALLPISSHADDLYDSRTDSEFPGTKAYIRTAQIWYNLQLENSIGLPKDNSMFYHYAEKGLLSKLKRLYDRDNSTFPLDKEMCNHAAKGGRPDAVSYTHLTLPTTSRV